MHEYDSFQINIRAYENMFLRRFPLVTKTFGRRLYYSADVLFRFIMGGFSMLKSYRLYREV